MTEPQIKCQYDGHQDEEIKALCIKQNCTERRTICFVCMQEERHKNHQKEILKFPQFRVWQKEGMKFLDSIRLILRSLDSVTKFFKDILLAHEFDQNQQINDLNNVQLSTLINKINFIKNLDNVLSKEIKLLEATLSQIKTKFKEFKPFIGTNFHNKENPINSQCVKSSQASEFQMEQQSRLTQSNWNKIQPKITNIIQFKFSETEKYNDLRILKEGQLVQRLGLSLEYSKLYGIAICEPQISQYGITTVSFQIKSSNNLIVMGVCSKQFIKKLDYCIDYQNSDHLLQLIRSDGEPFTFKKTSKSALKFTMNDIITIQFDPKSQTISWTKQKSQVSFIMKLELALPDVFFCIGVQLGCVNSLVEILKI